MLLAGMHACRVGSSQLQPSGPLLPRLRSIEPRSAVDIAPRRVYSIRPCRNRQAPAPGAGAGLQGLDTPVRGRPIDQARRDAGGSEPSISLHVNPSLGGRHAFSTCRDHHRPDRARDLPRNRHTRLARNAWIGIGVGAGDGDVLFPPRWPTHSATEQAAKAPRGRTRTST